MLRLVGSRGASQARRVVNSGGAASVRSLWLRPFWPAFYDDHTYKWVRQTERDFVRLWEPLRRTFDLHREIPLEVDADGGRTFRLRVDVSQFAPEEIRVSVGNRMLSIRARHEEVGKDYREYVSEHALPADVNERSIRSILGKDGVLTIEAKLPATEETEIPVEKESEKDK